MALIDLTYFVGPLNIPNTTELLEVANEVNWYINKYEPEFLQKALGYPLYKAYQADKENQRFKDIIEGAEYTDIYGNIAKWPGLIQEVKPAIPAGDNTPASPAQKVSVIANYVYYWRQRSNTTQSTGIGEVRPDGDNSQTVSPRQKMISSLNEIHYKVKELVAFLEAKQDVYTEWTYIDKVNALRTFGFINPIF